MPTGIILKEDQQITGFIFSGHCRLVSYTSKQSPHNLGVGKCLRGPLR